jgi:hypothetical protein
VTFAGMLGLCRHDIASITLAVTETGVPFVVRVR